MFCAIDSNQPEYPWFETHLNEPMKPVSPEVNEFIYETNASLDISLLPLKLIAPPAPEPPRGMSYPLDGYS